MFRKLYFVWNSSCLFKNCTFWCLFGLKFNLCVKALLIYFFKQHRTRKLSKQTCDLRNVFKNDNLFELFLLSVYRFDLYGLGTCPIYFSIHCVISLGLEGKMQNFVYVVGFILSHIYTNIVQLIYKIFKYYFTEILLLFLLIDL